ncbi:MAG: hypothetical protein ABIT83_05985 [Massilia sp.]
MTTLKESLEQLGDLHDVRVSSFTWDAYFGNLEFKFEDIYANFRGLENYPGPKPDSIILRQVKEVVFDLDASGNPHIYEFLVTELEGESLATVLFRPSGRITAKFTSADFPEVPYADLA